MEKSEQDQFNESLESCTIKAAYMNLVISTAAASGANAQIVLADIERKFIKTVKTIVPDASAHVSDAMLQEAITRTLTSMRRIFEDIRTSI